MKNIIEICVAIDIAIMGIAYPIIVDKLSNIGDKYSSEYISVLFNNEFPQRQLRLIIMKRQFEISVLKLTLYLTIISFLFLIFQFQPLFGWNNLFINNSASWLVLLFTAMLTLFFFIWLDKVVLYNGRSKRLLTKLIGAFHHLKDGSEIKVYHLKAINEITLYAVEKQDEHIQQTLVEFYARVFSDIRQKHEKSKPLVYPIDLYFLINKLNYHLALNENRKLRAIEHRAASGVWLLGEVEEITISNETYEWMWHNLYTICDKNRLVRMFWANSSQYFDYRLSLPYPDYERGLTVPKNQAEIDERKAERVRFLEVHLALGGLLLYRRQFNTIQYCLTFTQSQPPRYPLLPNSMKAILEWFEHFRNEFKTIGRPLDTRFYFPDLDNFGNSHYIKYWICRYLALLFIRQFKLPQYYVFDRPTSQPDLPDDTIEMRNWLDTIKYLKICVKANLEDKQLMEDLKFRNLIEEKEAEFESFLESLAIRINEKLSEEKLQTNLSEQKIQTFFSTTRVIIKEAFDAYNSVFGLSSADVYSTDPKISIRGGSTIVSKSVFTDNEVPTINYDSFFGGSIGAEIKAKVPQSFTLAKTHRYLLSKDNLTIGLHRIIGGRDDVLIISSRSDFEVEEILRNSFSRYWIKIPSTDYGNQNVLFVLKRYDLPTLEHIEPEEKEHKELELKVLDESLKLYASVVEMNDLKAESSGNSIDPKVQLNIIFHAVIHWKENREIVQIDIASRYKEQGIQSAINAIEPLSGRDNR